MLHSFIAKIKDIYESIESWWIYDVPVFIQAAITYLLILIVNMILIVLAIVVVLLLAKLFHLETILQLLAQ